MYKIKTKLNKAFYFMCALAITTFPSFAFATDVKTAFDDFEGTVADLITGSLGKAVALIALLLGGLMGLAKGSAWPALTGLAVAAIFGLGPFLITVIFDTFTAIK